jgi:CDGSH-type Zn-finger protein/uncharacterized Fe-S cluster protein YjdI
MDEDVHHYRGEKIEVTWDAKRCIHAEECLHRLGVVFDLGRRPWVLPDAASADELAETILYCPSGALHFLRKDSGAPEAPDAANTVLPQIDALLHVRGDIVIETPGGEVVLKDTRMTLCRCGASKNKPFCDKSHEQIAFQHNGILGESEVRTDERLPKLGPLKIIPTRNGPLVLRGPFEVRGCDQTSYRGNIVRLCRCRRSSNKPFCDDTHARIDFQSE